MTRTVCLVIIAGAAWLAGMATAIVIVLTTRENVEEDEWMSTPQ